MIEQARQLLCFVGAMAFLIAPGVLCIGLLLPSLSVLERWALGATAGLAASVFVAFTLAYWKLAIFFPLWAFAALVLAAIWIRRGARPPLLARASGITWLLALVLALVALGRFGVTFADELPPGWDPSFHLILAKKIALTGRMIFDWEPFENIGLNYPVGSHALVAITASIAHVPLHSTFKLLMPVFGVLTTALVFLFGSRVSGRADVGGYAALAYGLWAVYGSIDYYRWGGLPNAIAMAFFTAALIVACTPPADTRRSAITSVLLVAIALTHHHVMLVALFMLLALAGYSWVSGRRERALRGVLLPIAGAAIAGAFYLVPYALKATTLRSTGVFGFSEQLFTPALIVSSLGAVFCTAAIVGLILAARGRVGGPEIGSLHALTAALVFLFVVFEYIYRGISWARTGTGTVAFTPSRFLTDLAYPLAVYAGLAVAWVQDRFRLPARVVVATCFALSLTTIPALRARDQQGEPRFAAFQWIEAHTSPETLVLNDQPWAVYGTWRRCAATPIPVSEPSREGTAKALLFQSIQGGSVPPEARNNPIVEVEFLDDRPSSVPVLWRDAAGAAVMGRWPP